MKSGIVRGIVTGAVVGVAAMGIMGVMHRNTPQQRMSRYAVKTARKMANKASDLFSR